MEANFQTSFIPKKPMVEERAAPSHPISFLSIVALFILFTVLIATGGLYFYRGILNRNITQMNSDLNLAKERLEPAKITELQVLDKRLRAAVELLNKHIVITPIFKALQDITMKNVSYTNFRYGIDPSNKIIINLNGVAVGYRSIALQSDLFTEKGKNFIDPVFSNLSLDNNGNVLFNLSFSVDPIFVGYRQNLLINKNAGAN